MSMRMVVAVLLIGIATLGYFAWSKNTAKAPAMTQQSGETGANQGGAPGAMGGGGVMVQSGGDPGIEWSVPKRWSAESGSPMRLATYSIPGAGGADGGSCAVYYFGPGQGGGTDANIHRWIDEFENGGSPQRSSKKTGGLSVERVRVKGTYVAHAGMGGGGQGPQPNHELLGAIVEGPNGSVFFKLTGPAKSVDAAVGEFDGMLASLKKK